MRYSLAILLLMTYPAHAETFQIGEPINVNVTATVNSVVLIETRMVGDQIEATLNGKPVPYTVITDEETGEEMILVNGE